jgi:nucleoside-diphosphate-sugar epimerase
VPDNTAPNAYDATLSGVDYVVHIAGAWPLPRLHPDEDIYHPFITSTKNLISAAKKSGSLKRIVFTGAGAGLVDSEDGDTLGNTMDRVLDENVEVSQTSLTYRPPLKSAHNAYCAAKAQCMNYLSSLQASNTLPFSITQVIPGTVIGPSEFCTTAAQAKAHMDRQSKALLFADAAPRYAFGFVHVEDCARIHIEALDEEKIKDKDLPKWYIAAATIPEGITGRGFWGGVSSMLARNFREEVEKGVFTLNWHTVPINMPFRPDSRETERMLMGGQSMRGLGECVREVARWYVGLLKREETGDGVVSDM